jgi:dUTP pyrophosphatase
MNVKLIMYNGIKLPERNYYNDAGADVFAAIDCVIEPHSIKKVPLGFGLELPDGFVALVLPRSGMSTNKGITTEAVPIDSGYRGEIHAILYNSNDKAYTVSKGDKIAQLVILPIVLATFHVETKAKRENKGFGSSGY